jgi:hypothetical protein
MTCDGLLYEPGSAGQQMEGKMPGANHETIVDRE